MCSNINLLISAGIVEMNAHYGKVMSALRETIRLMREVDEVIESAGG